jgi:hypothetical protein
VRRLVADPRVPGRPELIGLLAAAQRAAAGDKGLAAELGDVSSLLGHLAASDPDPQVAEAAVRAMEELRSGPAS